jgi:RNA polymerase sigma-70 factor, ECF subfamily
MTDTAHDLFTRLFTESRDALRRYVRRFVRSEAAADEIVQEAFLRTYESGGTVRTPRAFLFSTAHHLAIDHRRRDHSAATEAVTNFDDPRIAGSGAPLEDVLIADEASRLLKQAIDRLPPQCHAALTLKVFHGYSYKEIGKTLGVSEKTVEKHIALGLDRTHEYLRARYSEYSHDQEGNHSG